MGTAGAIQAPPRIPVTSSGLAPIRYTSRIAKATGELLFHPACQLRIERYPN